AEAAIDNDFAGKWVGARVGWSGGCLVRHMVFLERRSMTADDSKVSLSNDPAVTDRRYRGSATRRRCRSPAWDKRPSRVARPQTRRHSPVVCKNRRKSRRRCTSKDWELPRDTRGKACTCCPHTSDQERFRAVCLLCRP